MRRPVRTVLGALLALAGAACVQETTLLVDQPRDSVPGDSTGGPGGGGRLRATLTLRIASEQSDSALVTALGWPGGWVPGAEVTAVRSGANATALTGLTDSAGTIVFPDIITGTYSISVIRLLSSGEAARLSPADADVTAFGGGGLVSLEVGGTDSTVAAASGRRGSLVISEANTQYIGDLDSYSFNNYLEIYNNSDTTIYLDGKLVGKSWEVFTEGLTYSCMDGEPFRLDPDNLHVTFMWQFPGSGRQYPLAPGRAAYLATDAIDHGAIIAGGLDLRGADFEFVEASDVDNPSVPNMIVVGPSKTYFFGHGFFFNSLHNAMFIADTMDVAALPLEPPPNSTTSGTLWARVSRAKVLDMAVLLSTYYLNNPNTQFCLPFIHRNFDRQPGFFLQGSFDGRSVHRRTLVTSGGRTILLRTRTTARGFEVRQVTPGAVP